VKTTKASVETASLLQGWIYKVQHSLLLRSLLLLAGWLLLFEIGWLVEYTSHASVWFPVSGFTFAALLLMGLTALPALLVGCVVITFISSYHYQLPLTDLAIFKGGLLFGLAHILPYGLGAALLKLLARNGIRDVTRVIVSFLVIAAVSSLVATGLVLTALVLSDMLPLADVAKTWLPFWIGDMAGVMVMAPFFVALLSKLVPGVLFRLTDLSALQPQRASAHFWLKLLLNALLVALAMVLAYVTQSPNSSFAIFFLVIPHMWIACSESPFYNVFSVAFSSFLIAFLVHVLGLMEFVMVYQFAINVIAANTLFGLALPTLLADNMQLRKVAFTDSLTQVASRERLEQRALLEMTKARQDDEHFSLMVFDIDNFKQINDEFGHHIGDHALQQLCSIAQHSLRPDDLLGRFGGDEFVILLPKTSMQAAQQIAERILEELQNVRVADVQRLTASFGVAELHVDDDYDSLFMRADQALYRAKYQGRNCVVLAEQPY
jgi:diguanylate cyclase (GGDEF)-like protein